MTSNAPAAESTPSPTTKHLIYIADPMCSWCWGFSPVIEAIHQRFGDTLPIRLVMGGLRAGNTKPMTEKDKVYIRGAWERVGAASGQPFDFALFGREGFIYDTEPACRAVVVMRRQNPAEALAFKARVSRAFYAEGRDTTNPDVLADLAAEHGSDRAAFATGLASPEARNETFRDFLTCQESGIGGFPTLLAGQGKDGYAVVTNGFQKLDAILPPLEKWAAA